ncbi:MAG: hypothetical protein A4E55_00884 [Pelotomaculum sp. PtaU1.Bin035]|nr:MAG: hypothetical protein A4E55_00884 [Pelotomaculum sp. PtaU1.Bin035]
MPKEQIVCRRLKGLMAENDITVQNLSKKMGISEELLEQKINGGCDWLFVETMFIVKEFGFSEVKEVFPELY